MSPLPSPPRINSTIIQINPTNEEMSNDPKPKRAKPSKSLLKKKRKELKTAHLIIEKKRRIKLNREFEMLKILVPACRNSIICSNYTTLANTNSSNIQINDGMYKLTILQATVEYINYLHEIIRLMRKSRDVTANADLLFLRLDLNLESYRDLEQEFNFTEIMKIFKLMGVYEKQSRRRSLNKEPDEDPNALVSNEQFYEFLLSRGIDKKDIDSFKLFFDVIDLDDAPRTSDASTPAFFKKDLTFWKKPAPMIPMSGLLGPSPNTMQISNFTNYSNKEFLLPGPILDLPEHHRRASLGFLSGFTDSSESSRRLPLESEINPEFFLLLPSTFSTMILRFDDGHKRAGEALLHMKRNSIDRTSPLLAGSDDTRNRARNSESKIDSILN